MANLCEITPTRRKKVLREPRPTLDTLRSIFKSYMYGKIEIK
jgi:hypothetical protein